MSWPVSGFETAVVVWLLGLVGLIAHMLRAGRSLSRPQTSSSVDAERPWSYRRDWVGGSISQEGGRETVSFLLGIGAFFLLFVWGGFALAWASNPQLPRLPEGRLDLERLALFAVAALVGIVPLAIAGWFHTRRAQFGDSVFQMKSVPGVIGGRLEGTIRISRSVAFKAAPKLVLRCSRESKSSTRRSGATALWQDSQSVPLDSIGDSAGQATIPVSFRIPHDCEPTAPAAFMRHETIWRLSAEAATRGMDYSALFEVPVYRTSESREAEAQAPPPHPIAQGPPAQPSYRPLARADGVSFRRRGHLPRSFLTWPLASLLLAALVSPLIPRWEEPAIAVLLGITALGLVYSWGGTLVALPFAVAMHPGRFSIGREGVQVRWGFGPLAWGPWIPSSDIAKTEVYHYGAQREIFGLRVIRRSGGSRIVARNVERDEADWLAAELHRLTGLAPA